MYHKAFYWFTFVIFLTSSLAAQAVGQTLADVGAVKTAVAQDLASDTQDLIASYFDNPGMDRDEMWWKSLEQQLNIETTRFDEVAAKELQNIIFFSNILPDRFDFSSSSSVVYDMYLLHHDRAMRHLALNTLHAIRDEMVLVRLAEDVLGEEDDTLRRTALAILADYQRK